MSVHEQVHYVTEQELGNIGFPIFAPLSGKIIPLSKHPQTIFARGILGCGVAVELSSHKISAPFDGSIEQIKLGGTEVYLKSNNGIKLLIAIDIDPSHFPLPGLCIKKLNKQLITRGEPLIYFDLRQIPPPIIASITVLNYQQLGNIYYSQTQININSDVLFKVTAKKRVNTK